MLLSGQHTYIQLSLLSTSLFWFDISHLGLITVAFPFIYPFCKIKIKIKLTSSPNLTTMATPTSKLLFTVPIPACDSHPGGSITVTEPVPQVYLLTILSPTDNRQTTAFCQAVLRALDLVEFGGLPAGVVVTTSALPKFYSNGLDLGHAVKIGDEYWIESLWKLYRRFLTFPMPTIA